MASLSPARAHTHTLSLSLSLSLSHTHTHTLTHTHTHSTHSPPSLSPLVAKVNFYVSTSESQLPYVNFPGVPGAGAGAGGGIWPLSRPRARTHTHTHTHTHSLSLSHTHTHTHIHTLTQTHTFSPLSLHLLAKSTFIRQLQKVNFHTATLQECLALVRELKGGYGPVRNIFTNSNASAFPRFTRTSGFTYLNSGGGLELKLESDATAGGRNALRRKLKCCQLFRSAFHMSRSIHVTFRSAWRWYGSWRRSTALCATSPQILKPLSLTDL